jgi:hypothetical protein
MPVLVSYANYQPWMWAYLPSYGRLLVDSGAFSELNSGVRVDLAAYVDFASQHPWAEAWAGLDDIGGDWRRSLANYEVGGFPTIHDTDPPELLNDLVAIARERGRWLGVGLVPPRYGKQAAVRAILDRIPDDLHVHGWALRSYGHLARFDSFDSTNWRLDTRKIQAALPWLTPAEAVDLVVLRYLRESRRPALPDARTVQHELTFP